MSRHRVTFTGTVWGTVTCQNVVHFDNPDGLLTNAQIAAELRDNWCVLLCAGMMNTAGFRNITVATVGSAVSPYNLPVVVNGIDAVDPTTGTMAVNQKFRIHTPTAGRKGRGRIYLWGYRANLVSQGIVNATGITNMTIRLNAIQARYVGIGHTGPIALGVMPRGGASADFIFADFLVLSLVPGVQRRRSVGVGL